MLDAAIQEIGKHITPINKKKNSFHTLNKWGRMCSYWALKMLLDGRS